MRASILVPIFLDGDAVGNDILGMHAALSKAGVEVKVFAQQWSESLSRLSYPLSDFPQWAAAEDCLNIYHHATYWDQGWEVFRQARGVKIVRHHSVTPPQFFSPYSPHYETAVRLAIEMAASMARSEEVDLFLATSQFTLGDLLDLGVPEEKCRVVPPFHNLSAFDDVEASVPILTQFLDGSINLVFVGRVAPNKGHHHLLRVVKAYRDLFGPRIRLLIVGDLDPRLESYHNELRQATSCLGLDSEVRFEGKVSLNVLKAYFLVADFLLVMSEHEGFCVPILEAAHLRLPILAYASSAIPETLGPKGMLFDRLDYELFAAAIHTLHTEKAYADWVTDQQTQHLRSAFDSAIIEMRFRGAIASFLH